MSPEEILQISKQYPWATEDTLDRVNQVFGNTNITMSQIAAGLSKASVADIRKIKRNAETAGDEATRTQKIVLATAKRTRSTLKTMISDSSPADAIAELAHEGAKLVANAGQAITGFTSNLGAGGKAASVLGNTVAWAAVATTGLGVIYAKLLTEQEKMVRGLIEVGSIASDLDRYTYLRSSAAALGMGLGDLAEITEATKPFIVSAGGSVLEGQIKLTEFLANIDNDKTFNDFGMAVQDQSKWLAQELEMLYQIQEVSELNAMTKRRVMDSFESANKLALFIGDSLGIQRDVALAARDEARMNIDFRVALMQNAQFIADNLGANAKENIDNATGWFAMLSKASLSSMSDDLNKSVASFVGNISFDQTAANDIPEELAAKLIAVGNGAFEKYLKLVEDIGLGNINTEAQAAYQWTDFVEAVKGAETKIAAYDPLLQSANLLIAESKLIPVGFFDKDLSELESTSYYKKFIDRADGTIDVLDDFAVTFKNIQELLTPGFESTGKGFEALTGSLMKFGEHISNFFQTDPDYYTVTEAGNTGLVTESYQVLDVKNTGLETRQYTVKIAARGSGLKFGDIINAETYKKHIADGTLKTWNVEAHAIQISANEFEDFKDRGLLTDADVKADAIIISREQYNVLNNEESFGSFTVEPIKNKHAFSEIHKQYEDKSISDALAQINKTNIDSSIAQAELNDIGREKHILDSRIVAESGQIAVPGSEDGEMYDLTADELIGLNKKIEVLLAADIKADKYLEVLRKIKLDMENGLVQNEIGEVY